MFKFKIILFVFVISQMMMACSQSSLPKIDKFSGNRKVLQGEKATLNWEVRNAKKLYLLDSVTNNKIEINPATTKFQFKPVTNYSYTLIVEGKNNQTEQKIFSGTIAKNPPIIAEFKGTEEYTLGSSTRASLIWRIEKADKVFLENYNEPLDKKQGKFFLPLGLDTTEVFKIVAIGQFGDTTTATHTVKVKKLKAGIRVASKFGSPEMIAGDNNVLTWDFPGAEVVQIEGVSNTFKPTDTYIVVPKKEDRLFETDFIVTYPNNKKTKVKFSTGVLRVKANFIPSKLKAGLYEKVTLAWNTESAKNIKLIVGKDTYENIDAKGKHTFTISKNTEVMLVFNDKYDEEHQIKWLVKCEETRPFIKNAIDYKDFKNDDNNALKKRLIFDIFQVDRSKFPDEIKLRILVTDTTGNFIRGLAPPSITEAEAKKFFVELVESIGTQQQTISNFKVKEINELKSSPYDIGLCLDYSGSMGSSINPLESAVRKFLNKKDDDDKMSLIRFDDKLKTEKPMTLSTNELIKDIEWKGLNNFGGSTALYAGIDEALETFDSTANSKDRQKILFVFTDGHENSSFSHAKKGRLFRAVDLALKARKRNIKLYPMGLGEGVNMELLNAMGWITDGKAIAVVNDSLIDEAYSELPRLFKNYYEITYKPIVSKDKENGKRQIGLKYFNNRKTITTFTNYQTNEKFSFDEEERNYYMSSISNNQKTGNKIILIPPQAVAFFDFDKSNLKPTFTANIEAVISFLKSNTKAKADIFGHTDLVGTSEKNMILSKQRAEEIKNYIVRKGIDANRLQVIPLGKSKPIWKEEKKEWQAQENRRIEILVWE